VQWQVIFSVAYLLLSLVLQEPWPPLPILLYYLPLAFISSRSALINHSVHPPSISVLAYPMLLSCVNRPHSKQQDITHCLITFP
jgi:hypothetical protein